MDKKVRAYLRSIGKKGGQKSRRALSSRQAKNMVQVREAKRAFKRFKTSCFWSYDPHLLITKDDIPWVAQQLMQNGDRDAWLIGKKLCR